MSDPTKRIISHMNKDHQLSLIDYVVVYGNEKEKSFDHSSVNITDVTDKYLTLEYVAFDEISQKKILTIEWEIAQENENVTVNTLKDVKAKLIAMAKYAAKKQGYSHTQIKTVTYPTVTLFEYPIMLAYALASYDTDLFRSLFTRDPVVQKVSQYLPSSVLSIFSSSFATTRLSRIIFAIIVSIHFAELFLVMLPLLRKYRVPTKQSSQWIIMQLFEGFPAFLRFKALEPKD